MSYTVTTSVGVSAAGGTFSATRTHTCTDVRHLSDQVAGLATDALWSVALDISQIQYLIISTDQDLTLETNSGGAPQETIALAANNALEWYKDAGIAIATLFAGDVTALYFTNAGATAANVSIEVGLDATP